MSRSTLIYLIIAGAASGTACDKSGSETEAKIGEAKTTLTSAVVEAGAGAAAEVQSAQVAAETKISSAQADFATTREDYRHKIQSDLDSVDHKVDDLDAKAGTETGMVKTRLSATLPALRRQRDALREGPARDRQRHRRHLGRSEGPPRQGTGRAQGCG